MGHDQVAGGIGVDAVGDHAEGGVGGFGAGIDLGHQSVQVGDRQAFLFCETHHRIGDGTQAAVVMAGGEMGALGFIDDARSEQDDADSSLFQAFDQPAQAVAERLDDLGSRGLITAVVHAVTDGDHIRFQAQHVAVEAGQAARRGVPAPASIEKSQREFWEAGREVGFDIVAIELLLGDRVTKEDDAVVFADKQGHR